MSAESKSAIAAEFARRAKQFHPNEKPMEIELWGLFRWGDVSPYIKTGEIIPNPEFKKENRTIWCKPSQAFFDKWIARLLAPNSDGSAPVRFEGREDEMLFFHKDGKYWMTLYAPSPEDAADFEEWLNHGKWPNKLIDRA